MCQSWFTSACIERFVVLTSFLAVLFLSGAYFNKGIIQLKCVLPLHQALCDVAHAQSQAVREAPESLQEDVKSNYSLDDVPFL